MARVPTMVIQDEYIDMDLTPSSPQRALLEFEFQSASSTGGGVSSRHSMEAAESPADELFYRGKLLPLHLPPRLQLVQKLLQEQQQARAPETIKPPAPAGPPNVCAGEEDGNAKAAGARKYSWSKRLKLMKRWTSREYLRSLFMATATPGGDVVSGRARALDQDELCGHRRSFSGIVRRVRLVVATTKASPSAPATSPLCSSSSASSSSASTPSCGSSALEGLFLRAAGPALKRSSSAGSEEGGVHGAIAHCKRSHQQQLLQQGRRSASGAVFYSLANTPRVSASVAAAASEAAAQKERQEICRG